MHLRKMVGRVIISLEARKIKERDAVAGWIVFPILIVFLRGCLTPSAKLQAHGHRDEIHCWNHIFSQSQPSKSSSTEIKQVKIYFLTVMETINEVLLEAPVFQILGRSAEWQDLTMYTQLSNSSVYHL